MVDGIVFDSKAESEYYIELKWLLENKIIDSLELQPKVYLTESRILYKPDFLVGANDKFEFVDVKGMATPVFNIKKRTRFRPVG